MKRNLLKVIQYINQLDISVVFFLLFVFLLPFKTRLEVLTDYSYLDNMFVDYLTISIYGFEIFFLFTLIFWVVEMLRDKKKIFIGDKKIFYSLISLLLASFFSLYFATAREIGLYYVVVLIGLLLSYLFIVNKFQNKKDYILLLNIFLFSIFLQSIIGIFQFINNASIGLHFFGESLISPVIDGVAKTIINGVRHIRPYGTFPHSNIFAIFLLLAGTTNIYLFSLAKNKYYKIYLSVIFIFSIFALFFTFSRVAWLIAFFCLGFYLLQILSFRLSFYNFKKIWLTKRKWLILTAILFIGLVIFLFYFSPAIWWRINPMLSTTWQSWQDRYVVVQKSILIYGQNLWGVGIGNNVITLAYQMKNYPTWMIVPVHNTLILVLVELGFIGLLSFISLIFFIFQNIKKLSLFLKLVFIIFVISMLFDHAFWDIRQTQYLLFIFIAIISMELSRKNLSSTH